MARQGNDAAFSELSRRAERHLRAGMLADYTDDLRRMASVLHEEGRYHDELKVRMLDFHVMLNCGDTLPAIDCGLVQLISDARARSGLSRYEADEMFLESVHEDSTPRRLFTPRDSLYILELCSGGREQEAENIVGGVRRKVSVI